MTRIGINPARGKFSDYRPARVTVTMLTYIPDQAGYFQDRLQVLQLALNSLRAHTPPAHDLMIFDNGSCPEVVEYLRQLQAKGQLDYLILSEENIGKIGALRILFSAAPGEIIAYSDDDILFYPGWLEAHLEILEAYAGGAFPPAGMVSGVPVRNAARHARSSLENLAQNPPAGLKVSFERSILDEWEADWAASTGRDAQKHLQETQSDLDMVLTVEKHPPAPPVGAQGLRPEHGSQAVCIGGANHFQFVGHRQVLLQALPAQWSGKLMGHMVELDQAVDELGYLRLSTAQRYTRHLGNALSQESLAEARQLGLLDEKDLQTKSTTQPQTARKPGLLRIPGSRRILLALYKRIFDILYR
ncbi:MAG: glycosyltransferase family A protein [Chloroflexota bacterium]